MTAEEQQPVSSGGDLTDGLRHWVFTTRRQCACFVHIKHVQAYVVFAHVEFIVDDLQQVDAAREAALFQYFAVSLVELDDTQLALGVRSKYPVAVSSHTGDRSNVVQLLRGIGASGGQV